MFGAIASISQNTRQMRIASMARLRTDELLKSGDKSLVSPIMLKADPLHVLAGYGRPPDNQDIEDYKILRREADVWQAKRTAFMLARLTAGRHPDTDPTFWAGWHDYGPPQIPVPLDRRIFLALGRPGGAEQVFYGNVFACLIALLFGFGSWRKSRKCGSSHIVAFLGALGIFALSAFLFAIILSIFGA